MKFRVERDVLAEAVAWVARGLSNRPPVPVLGGVLVEADTDDTVTLSAFDYEQSAKVTIAADVTDAGTVLVNGKLLSDISRSLPAKPVELADEGSKVQLTCGSSRFALLKMPVEEYPTLPVAPEPAGVVPGDVFSQAVAQVAIAADRGDTLPILTGVRMQVEGEKVTMLATDRYRLAMRELTWTPQSPDLEAVALIPAKTLHETARSLGSGADVSIALGQPGANDSLIGFAAGRRESTSRLLDGDYPKVAGLFPSSADTIAVIDTHALIEAVRRVALVAERNTPVRLRFSDGQLAIEAGTGDDAQASEAIEATVTGPEIEIAFNPGFLLDGLGAVGTPFSRLSFRQANLPAVLSGQQEQDGDSDESFRYVLMPVRFS